MLIYHDAYHEDLIKKLEKWPGNSSDIFATSRREQAVDLVIRRPVKGIMVVLKQQLAASGGPVLIWLLSNTHA